MKATLTDLMYQIVLHLHTHLDLLQQQMQQVQQNSQGSAGAYVQIVVATGAPTLYYYCSSHSGMGGTANTTSPALNTLIVTTTDGGNDNITSATYAGFDDVIYAATGHAFSIDSNGDLIDTI